MDTPFSVKDDRRFGFLIVENEFMDKHAAAVGPFGIAVYCALARLAGSEGACWPSHATLASMTGCSVSSVQRALSALERRGVISHERRETSRGGETSCMYTLHTLGPTDRPPRSERPTPSVPQTDKEDTTTHTQAPTPTQGSPEDWTPVYKGLAALYGGIPYKRKDGKLMAWAGQTAGVMGKHVPDVASALAAIRRLRKSGELKYLPTDPNRLPAFVGKWLASNGAQSQALAEPRGIFG